MSDRPFRIGVIGSGVDSDAPKRLAREVGAEIAAAGAILVCGGLGGVMAAAAEGAASRGGLVLGFLPGARPEAAAAGVSVPIATGLGEARNTLVVRAAESVIALAGGWGTMNEAALCMKIGVPLVGLADRLPDAFPIEHFHGAAAAVERALDLAAGRRG